MAAFVVDASVVVKWAVAEEWSREATQLLGRELMAPTLLQAECANVLWTKARRREITSSEAKDRAAFPLGAPIRLVPPARLRQ